MRLIVVRVRGEPMLAGQMPGPTPHRQNLTSNGVQLAGPLEARTDAQGNLGSFYVYDPDGILIQLDRGGGGQLICWSG